MRAGARTAGGSIYLRVRMHILRGMHRVDGIGVSELWRRTGAATAARKDGCALIVAAIFSFQGGALSKPPAKPTAVADGRTKNEAIGAIA